MPLALTLLMLVLDFAAIRTLLLQDPFWSEMAAHWLLNLAWLPAASIGILSLKRSPQAKCRWARLLLTGTLANLLLGATCLGLVLTVMQKDPMMEWVLFLVLYCLRLLPGAVAFILISPIFWIKAAQRGRYTSALLLGQALAWGSGYLLLGQSPDWPHTFFAFGLFLPYWAFTLMLGGSLLTTLSSQSPKAD
jgi:hypothetical protein